MSQSAATARRTQKSASALVEVCSVRLGKTLFGMPIRHILEIVGAARPQPVPLGPRLCGRPGPLSGRRAHHGSLRQLLAFAAARRHPGHPGSRKSRRLLRPSGRFSRRSADRAGRRLRTQSFDPRGTRRDLLAGAYKLKDSLLVMLDPERLDPGLGSGAGRSCLKRIRSDLCVPDRRRLALCQ